MKRFFTPFALILVSLAVLSSCEMDGSFHNHSFNRTWTVTEEEHWKDANCGHELVSKKGEHEWDEGKETKSATEDDDGEFTYTCKVCKHTKKTVIPRVPHVHTFGGEYVYNDNYHWQNATCEHTILKSKAEAHRFNNNECFTCGYLSESEGLSYTQRSDGTYSVTGISSCRDSKIVIPASHEGVAVTAISKSAFAGVESITKVIIPETITSIGTSAFSLCKNLSEIVWKDGKSNLQTIGSMAFSTTPIREFTIPATVTKIGGGAFYYCESLNDLKLEEGNTAYKIVDGGLYTADGTTLLQYALGTGKTSFTVLNTVKTLGYGAFAYNTSLKEIIFEEGSSITTIPTNAVSFILTLESINIPQTVTSIEERAFYNCKKLKALDVPSAVSYIGPYAFHGCNELAPFDIPAALTTIGEYAFAYCDKFVNVTIPDKVTTIGDYAFTGCTGLKTMSIPASVKTFGKRVFFGCKVITDITVSSDNPTLRSIDGNLYNKAGTGLVYYCVGKSNTEFNVPSGVTSLYAFSIYEANNLKKVTLPNTLTLIREEAFRNCYALEEIVMPDSVKTIERAAFMDCQSLITLHIPTALTTLTSEIFRGCKSLAHLTIPGNITTIERRAFGTLESLDDVVFEVTEGWYYLTNLEGADYLPFDSNDIADPKKAADFLTVTSYGHFNHTWKLNP